MYKLSLIKHKLGLLPARLTRSGPLARGTFERVSARRARWQDTFESALFESALFKSALFKSALFKSARISSWSPGTRRTGPRSRPTSSAKSADFVCEIGVKAARRPLFPMSVGCPGGPLGPVASGEFYCVKNVKFASRCRLSLANFTLCRRVAASSRRDDAASPRPCLAAFSHCSVFALLLRRSRLNTAGPRRLCMARQRSKNKNTILVF